MLKNKPLKLTPAINDKHIIVLKTSSGYCIAASITDKELDKISHGVLTGTFVEVEIFGSKHKIAVLDKYSLEQTLTDMITKMVIDMAHNIIHNVA